MELFLRSQLKTKRINGCTWTMVTLSFFQISFWMMLHTCFKKSQSWRNSCVRTYTWCSHIESKVFFFFFFLFENKWEPGPFEKVPFHLLVYLRILASANYQCIYFFSFLLRPVFPSWNFTIFFFKFPCWFIYFFFFPRTEEPPGIISSILSLFGL